MPQFPFGRMPFLVDWMLGSSVGAIGAPSFSGLQETTLNPFSCIEEGFAADRFDLPFADNLSDLGGDSPDASEDDFAALHTHNLKQDQDRPGLDVRPRIKAREDTFD